MIDSERKEIPHRVLPVSQHGSQGAGALARHGREPVGGLDAGEGRRGGRPSIGRRIAELTRKKVAELSDDEYAHLQKVAGYVHRQKAERPKGDLTQTRWRFSLRNWGHDPLKDS